LGKLAFLKESSIANVQGTGSLPLTRLESKLGTIPLDALNKIKQALAFAVEM
jgi:mRNA-degrading endonuclease toxin of MazEF toxin-antitoxin module